MKKSDTFWYATMFGVVTGSAGALVMSIATHDAYDHTDSFYNPGIFSFIIFGVAFFIWVVINPDVPEWRRQRALAREQLERQAAVERDMAERKLAEETAQANTRRKLLEDEAALPNAASATYKTASPIELTETARALAERLNNRA